ncbi:hypothetical protein BRC82_08675 [Halobacteriales archaeon QS_1_67_19]|nr:MAG: hypothetical protein BRC82_08675 [Halobacteriales archaeon QS_1_67_19]
METRTVEQVKSWNTRSFADGFAGLRELSDGEFSGAVRAGGAWLFMLNGRIIGVYGGSLDDFDGADGTAYAAPHPSLPLLFSMREKGGDTQAKYYTNDTPLSEVDSTLSEGKFTGYIELSENVLSGDYYVTYYGGRSMSVAFVGASEQVVTGEEAFERADDEVGIYEVRDVDLEVTDVPEPETPDESAGATGGAAVDETPDRSAREQEQTARDQTESTSGRDASRPTGTAASQPDRAATRRETASDTAGGRVDSDQSGTARTDASTATEADTAGGTQAGAETDRTAGGTAASEAAEQSSAATSNPSLDAAESATGGQAETTVDATESPTADRAEPTPTATDAETAESPGTDERGTEPDDSGALSEEETWRETTTIPSLDPDRSEGPAEESESDKRATAGNGAAGGSAVTADSPTGRADRGSSDRSAAAAQSRSQSRSGSQSAGEGAAEADEGSGEVRELRSQLEQRTQQVQTLRDRLSDVESERDELRRERDALRQEVERLEAKLETASAGGAGSSGARLSPAEAFAGTNLFVRYQSKGEATLEEAAAGDADPEAVNANLQLEHHTQFDADGAEVEGEPFESFLTDSFEYRFATWIVEELLYEIRDTGHRGALRDLYEALPAIDRVDLHGSVDAGADDEDTREESFDVIMRDRMGNPLLVADLNGDREPTTGEMMGSLVDAASGVAETHEELVGAFQVTESFFEPEALETAETATSGGFLSREKRESFVKLSRKRGYHLCLVESRSGGFHLNVPEL